MNITRLALFLATGLLVSAGLPLQAMAVTDHCAPDDSPPPNRIDPIMADVPSNQLDGDLVVGRDRHSERKLIQRDLFVNGNLETFSRVLGDLEPLRDMAQTISDTWVNFAREGKPRADALPRWQPFNAEDRATMVFDTSIELQHDIDREIRGIWDG